MMTERGVGYGLGRMVWREIRRRGTRCAFMKHAPASERPVPNGALTTKAHTQVMLRELPTRPHRARLLEALGRSFDDSDYRRDFLGRSSGRQADRRSEIRGCRFEEVGDCVGVEWAGEEEALSEVALLALELV